MTIDKLRARFEELRSRFQSGEDVEDALLRLEREVFESTEGMDGQLPDGTARVNAEVIRREMTLGDVPLPTGCDRRLVDLVGQWTDRIIGPTLAEDVEGELAAYTAEVDDAARRREQLHDECERTDSRVTVLVGWTDLLDSLSRAAAPSSSED